MFVTNQTKGPLGIDGVIILRPQEENRFVPDTPEYKTRVQRLVEVNKASVSNEEGLTKYCEDKVEPVGEVTKVDPVKEPEAVTETAPESNGEEPETKKTTSKQRR